MKPGDVLYRGKQYEVIYDPLVAPWIVGVFTLVVLVVVAVYYAEIR